ncbi:E3 ubiquitin-protein ligase SINAT3 [Hordeum vulgare]|nr:E3 ubiquitin-protein ligase SINAT3 [Hordeum vulgare]
MDMDSVECLSLPDASMDVDDVNSHQQYHHHNSIPIHPVHLAASGGVGGRAFAKMNAGAAAAAGGVGATAGAAGGPPATSVHELLECPVCINSMFPPIHQVGALCGTPRSLISGWLVYASRFEMSMRVGLSLEWDPVAVRVFRCTKVGLYSNFNGIELDFVF